ncbi:MAG TPA: hypothetical protein VNJ28_01685, partial [Candidatus Limnocylindrales bacterium]|nr:hypothetical protein [Candidatus Limnocylindrales bacterium]
MSGSEGRASDGGGASAPGGRNPGAPEGEPGAAPIAAGRAAGEGPAPPEEERVGRPTGGRHDPRATGLRVLVVARWYPAHDDPGRGSFVADQVGALRAAGVDLVVASWEPARIRGTPGERDERR